MSKIIVLLLLTETVLSQYCSFDLQQPYLPLVFDRNFNFPTDLYDNSTVHFATGERFYAICPRGTSNPMLYDDGEEVLCVNGTTVHLARFDLTLDFAASLPCVSRTPAHVVNKLRDKCANNYTEFEVGMEINDQLAKIYTVCFDEERVVPFYAQFVKNSRCTLACPDLFYPYVDAGGVYEKDLYNVALNRLRIIEEWDVALSFGITPLLQQEYFFDVQRKKTTFDYVSQVLTPYTTPLHLSSICIDHLPLGSEAYIGTLDVAVYPDSVGNLVELYADDGKMPLPKWFWCVYYTTNPTVDGKIFSILSTQVNLGEVPLATMTEWWLNDICATNTDAAVVSSNEYRGNCTFADIINPQLIEFIDTKWPGARTLPSY